MEKSFHFAVDLGATSGRTILASFDGERVEMKEISRFSNPMLPIGNHIFWNLPGLYSEILDGLKRCRTLLESSGDKLSSIGIDSWGCDVAYFYPDGSIAGLPYCYRDIHTQGSIESFAKQISKEEIYAKTGIQFMDFNTLFQLDTINRNNPDLIKDSDKILFIPDALNYMLTGNAVTERTVASTSQLLNPYTGELDEDLLKKIGISSDKFGMMVKPGTTIGTLTGEVKEYTGLGDIPVIAVAGHDTASAVIAVPTPDENYAYLSCGTWSLLGIESDNPVINEDSRRFNFTNEGGLDGTVRLLKNICGLWIFEQSRKHFKDAPDDVADLVALCERSDCKSLIDPDSTQFVNPSNMVEAIRSYCKETRQATPETTSDFIRVIFRSLAQRYKEVLSKISEISTKKIKRLHVIGGGSRNQYLMQFTADAIGIPVVAGPAECTALGNVLVQLKGNGIVSGIREMREISRNSTITKTYQPK